MGTEAHLWSLSTLRSARANPGGSVDVDPDNPVVFTIPAFQRSLVWPKSKQRDLIASILKGHPFGALLLVEHTGRKTATLPSGATVQAKDYGIIDGLQRTNAIVEHLRNSLAFATEDAVIGEAFDRFHAETVDAFNVELQPSELVDAVVAWMHVTRTPNMAEGFDFDTLLESVTEQLSLSDLTQEIRSRLKVPAGHLLNHIQSKVDIGDLKIPVMIYSGPDDDLPDIFEKINTAGTVLSKYEIYAASWVSTVVPVDRADVREAIARRYKVLETEGFDVSSEPTKFEYSLFDYLHGLSQVLGETYPALFPEKSAAENKLSAAFPLATLMFGRSLDKMAQLSTFFPVADGKIQVNQFETALFEAADFVDSVLAPKLAFRFLSDGDSLAHGELQVVSMIAAAASHLVDHTQGFKPRGTSTQRQSAMKSMKLAIPQHYIYDIIRQHWRGSLYTYAMERVWEGSNPSKAYLTPVSPSSFDSAFATAFSEQMADATHTRKRITAGDRALLKFLYSPVVSVQDQAAHKDYDVEHLIPVKRIQSMTEGQDPWAIGSIGNLGVLPAGPNRIKKDETVVEYLARPKNGPSTPVRELIEKLILVPIESVAIPKDDNGADAMTKEQYDTFVEENWMIMTSQLKANLEL